MQIYKCYNSSPALIFPEQVFVCVNLKLKKKKSNFPLKLFDVLAPYVHVFSTVQRESLTERKAAFRLRAGNYSRKWGFRVHPSWHRQSEKCVNTQAVNPPVLTIQGNKEKKNPSFFLH